MLSAWRHDDITLRNILRNILNNEFWHASLYEIASVFQNKRKSSLSDNDKPQNEFEREIWKK